MMDRRCEFSLAHSKKALRMRPTSHTGTRNNVSIVCRVFSLVLLTTTLLARPVQSLHRVRAVDILGNDKERHRHEDASSPQSEQGEYASKKDASLRGTSTKNDSAALQVQELWFQQRLDHFRSDSRTFPQRYFYSNQYVHSAAGAKANATSYSFLCCGGEGPDLDSSVLVDSVHCSGDMLELAAKLYHQTSYSVHLYALEHRYYGQSYPSFDNGTSSPVTNENLVYLSSRQAVADIGHFIGSRANNNKWVTFGGSYPGMVAAWARLKYPHAVTAAVSNSAPIQAQLDFAAYDDHVALDYANPAVGGSKACLDVFVSGHADLAGMLQEEDNHLTIAQAFGLCNVSALKNTWSVQLFLGDGVYKDGDIQGNDPSCETPLCNIAKVCATVLEQRSQGASDIDALAWIVRAKLDANDCTDLDWEATLEAVADPVRGRSGGLRSWLWQTCTEFGFYQTCESNSTCPYGRGYHTIDQDLELCSYAFGVEPAQVSMNIQETLDYYGGLKLAGSQILSVNGDIDPWSELAKRTTSDPDLPVLTVVGASHHFWTHAVKPTDSPAVDFSRQVIHQTVTDWLEESGELDDDAVPPKPASMEGLRYIHNSSLSGVLRKSNR